METNTQFFHSHKPCCKPQRMFSMISPIKKPKKTQHIIILSPFLAPQKNLTKPEKLGVLLAFSMDFVTPRNGDFGDFGFQKKSSFPTTLLAMMSQIESMIVSLLTCRMLRFTRHLISLLVPRRFLSKMVVPLVPVTRTPNFYGPLECKNGGEHHEIWRASSHDTRLSENLSSVGQISSKFLLTSLKIWKISMLNEFPETRRKTIKVNTYQSLRLLPLKQMAEHNLKPSVIVCWMLQVAAIIPFWDSEAPNPTTNHTKPLKQNKRQQTTRPPHSHPTSTFPSNFHIPIQHAARDQGTSWDKVKGEETMAQALKWERASKKLRPSKIWTSRFEVWSREPAKLRACLIYIFRKKWKKNSLPAPPDFCVCFPSLSIHLRW